jgi:lipocalin-like protein
MLDPVGVWCFVAGYAIAEDTGERIDLYGADPRGYGIFERGGRMMALLEAGGRVAGQTEAEMAELYRSVIAYSGKWSVDAEKFVTEVDLASDPGLVGTSQVRYYTYDGEIMSLRTPPLALPGFNGRRAVVYADWKREG